MNMLDFRLCMFVYVNLFLSVYASIPEEKLCANLACSEPISQARGSVTYTPDFENGLGFQKGQEILIISKSNKKNGYWGAVSNGKFGYVPSDLIKETKIFYPTIKLVIVKTETTKSFVEDKTSSNEFNLNSEITDNVNDILISSSITENIDKTSNEVLKNSLLREESLKKNDTITPVKPFEVIEGTTVFNDQVNEILSTPATASKINTQTAMPQLNLNEKSENEIKMLDKDKNILKIQDFNYQENKNSFFSTEVEKNDNEKFKLNLNNISSESVVSNALSENNEEKGKEKVEKTKNFDNANSINLKAEALILPNDPILHENNAPKKNNVEVLQHDDNKINNKDKSNNKDEEDVDNEDDEDDVDNVEEEEENEDEDGEVRDEETENYGEELLIETENFKSLEQNSENVVKEKNLVDIKNSNAEPNQDDSAKETLNSNLQSTSDVINNNTTQLNENQDSDLKSFTENITNINFDINSTTGDAKSNGTNNVEKVKTENLENIEIVESNNDSPVLSLSSSLNVNSETLENNNHLKDKKYSNQETFSEVSDFDLINNSLPNKNPDLIDLLEKDEQNFISNKNNLDPIPKSIDTESEELPKFDSNLIFENKIQTENVQSIQLKNIVTEKIEAKAENLNEIQPKSDIWTESQTENLKYSNPIESIEEKTEISETIISNIEDIHSDSLKSDLQSEILPQESNTFLQIMDWVSNWFKTHSNNDYKENTEAFHKKDVAGESLNIESNILNAAPEFCEKEECSYDEEVKKQFSFWNAWTSGSIPISNNIFVYLVVTAVTVLLFTLGHNYIEAKGKTGPLIAKINKLEQEFLVTSKECLLLKDEVQNARDKIIMYENSANDELVIVLQNELEESKKAKLELENSVEVLQQELDAATEAGLDLNKMLSEVLTQKGGSESLLQSVENLQSQLNSQQMIIDEMTQKLGIKNKENEALNAALQESQEKCESLEEQLSDIKENMNSHYQEKDAIISNLKSEIYKLSQKKEQDFEQLQKELEDLKINFTYISGALTMKEEEFNILKNSVKQIESKGNIDFKKLFYSCRVKAELIKAQKDNETLSKKLQEAEVLKKSLNEILKSNETEILHLKEKSEEAEKNKEEAEKKLEVLSTYFKEKETQLQKELGLQEALWAQKKGDEKAVYNMMKSLEEEIESYKSQNETLKKEILDQERGLKNQIATLEQKAHENWVAARQAERKLEENKHETAQLRNRLTLVEKNINNDNEGKANHYTEEMNGVEATSPILHSTSSPLMFPPLPMDPNSSSLLPPGFMPPHPMFIPPPMGGFIPPPPFLPGDRRPPPLGRMSSPPLNNRFSPPLPPDFPLGRMTSPPLSPHSRNYRSPTEDDRERENFRHRTPPCPPIKPRNWEETEETQGFIPISSQRDSRQEQKSSNISSGHSSSDSLDQSSRHSGRV